MILLSYDLSHGHTEVKNRLKTKGYQALLANTPIPVADPTPSGGAFGGFSASIFGNALETLARLDTEKGMVTNLRGVAEALLDDGFPLAEALGAFGPEGEITELPNTTLLHSTKSRENAIIDLYNAMKEYNWQNKAKPAHLRAVLCCEVGDYIFWGKDTP